MGDKKARFKIDLVFTGESNFGPNAKDMYDLDPRLFKLMFAKSAMCEYGITEDLLDLAAEADLTIEWIDEEAGAQDDE